MGDLGGTGTVIASDHSPHHSGCSMRRRSGEDTSATAKWDKRGCLVAFAGAVGDDFAVDRCVPHLNWAIIPMPMRGIRG